MSIKHKVYMGWDSREPVAYDVARQSILRRAVEPKRVQIVPLELQHLGHILTRPIEKKDGRMWCPLSQAPMSTEFAISRFCVPFLQKRDWALFCDCDIVCLADIAELFAMADDRFAVMCVKHKHEPTEVVKMDEQVQTSYARKNWSSVVLWNCDHPAHQKLTLEALNTLPGRDLHAFKWLADEEIGELPLEWNYLVGVNESIDPAHAAIAHFTLGGPWLKDWKGGPADELWRKEAELSGLL